MFVRQVLGQRVMFSGSKTFSLEWLGLRSICNELFDILKGSSPLQTLPVLLHHRYDTPRQGQICKNKQRKKKPPSSTIVPYRSSFKLTCHPCVTWADNLLFSTKEINSLMRRVQIRHKHLSYYKYLTFPAERLFVCSRQKSSMSRRFSSITVILPSENSYPC